LVDLISLIGHSRANIADSVVDVGMVSVISVFVLVDCYDHIFHGSGYDLFVIGSNFYHAIFWSLGIGVDPVVHRIQFCLLGPFVQGETLGLGNDLFDLQDIGRFAFYNVCLLCIQPLVIFFFFFLQVKLSNS